MKAAMYAQYGSPDVIRLVEVDTPSPREDEVLVSVKAASLNAFDWHMLRAKPFLVRLMGGGFLRPKVQVLGADLAGTVEAVGQQVTQFKPGDAVFGEITSSGTGAFAEYACAREKYLAPMPAGMTFEEAAALPMAGMTALQGLRDIGKIQAGQKVLIQGASGGVGTYAVQIAKADGAHVTAVCSTAKVDLMRELGADEVIDYTKVDFTRGEQRYDLILAANGYHSLADYKRVLSDKGIYVMAGGQNGQLFQAVLLGSFYSEKEGKKMAALSAVTRQEDLLTLKELVEAGKVKSVIDRSYPLDQVADAMRHLEEGHARGKIILTMLM